MPRAASVAGREGQPQPQLPPQHPPPARGAGSAAPRVSATVESSRTVSGCPSGQVAGSDDALIGRCSTKVAPQERQRNS